MFSSLNLEEMAPGDRPRRSIRPIMNAALVRLDRDFAELDAAGGRGSMAPKKLLRALLLQAFYAARFERKLVQQSGYNMLFRWLAELSMHALV